MSTILALDLGTATGWALRTPEGQVLSGTRSLKPGCCEDSRPATWVDWQKNKLLAHWNTAATPPT